MNKTIFVAGATGVIGKPLCKMLLDAGWTVYGITRTEAKAAKLAEMGVKPVVVDAFDKAGIARAMAEAKPSVVSHQLTDLPDGLAPEQMEAALERNARIREEGTRNLVEAAEQAGVEKFIAQSIAFVYEPKEGVTDEESPLLNFADPTYGETSRAVHSLEQQTLNGKFVGIVLRNGLLYGKGTGFDAPFEGMASVNVDAAVRAAFLAIDQTESGIFNIADDSPTLSTAKAKAKLGWDAGFRL
ncbi:NAD-dependent epimerase/dehydratase family protein [Neisseria chenwenguii]|uniref:Carbon-nitrogen hydrolase n=1 Tax=Neisseria chenwenguii TaxID=1853278 RepID=A0A220S4U3_9NEIS|nr:NAD(P)-dependent oxidoreductase [Neisseria chenwenguii]ASK28470.1 carbon-nitrogen hydrolase [Neisseria chenwenguii]ROV57077.1 NAD(P)-dependent oxidoreductase [Neisseria chenwenguii]